MDPAKRLEILRAYGRLLDGLAPYTIGDENDLPCSRQHVEEALLEEISTTIDPSILQSLETGYVLLGSFVRTDQCATVRAFETWVREATQGKHDNCQRIPHEDLHSEIQQSVARDMERRLQKVKDLRYSKFSGCNKP